MKPTVKCILVYDASCPFCKSVATYCYENYEGLTLLPNTSKKIPYIDKKTASRDVHLITEHTFKKNTYHRVYSGADAVVRVMSIGYPSIPKLYRIPFFNRLIKMLYFILKKVRKYL